MPLFESSHLREPAMAKSKGQEAVASRRFNELQNYLPPDVVGKNHRASISVLKNYADCFYLPGDKLGASRLFKYPIKSKGNDIINIPQDMDFLKRHSGDIEILICDLLEQGIIRKSTSPFNFPFKLEAKKPDSRGNIKYRICVDFSVLNARSDTEEAVPIPSITDLVDELHWDHWFSVIDLASASYQIALEPQDCHKAAITTSSGHYEFQRVPIGLKNASQYTQRMMNEMLKDMKGKVFVCHDDILIHSHNVKEHKKRLREVLDRLRDAGLKLQPDKCQLFQNKVTYLGYVIAHNHWLPDPIKVEALRTHELPFHYKDLGSFLGLCSTYSRFIPNHAALAKPLFDDLKRQPISTLDNVTYTVEASESFNKLKLNLYKTLRLCYPDWSREFNVEGRASENGIQATLRHKKSRQYQARPIAHASRTYKPAETKYTKAQKKILALDWGNEQFCRYLEHARQTRSDINEKY